MESSIESFDVYSEGSAPCHPCRAQPMMNESSLLIGRRKIVSVMVFGCLAVSLLCLGPVLADAPTPLLKKGDAVDWWFVFKFNATSFPGCGDTAERVCPSSRITCWDDTLGDVEDIGAVEIAESGQWDDQELGLKGGQNHAKIGVSTSRNSTYSIFGDLNQEGALLKSQYCDTSQNGRGGLFFVLEDRTLFDGVKLLLKGDTAGTKPPK
jgi:hypothetical protein